MELEKKKIYMNRQKARVVTQVTVDEDRNVPDVKPDMRQIIVYKGMVEPDELRASEGKVNLRGKLQYYILYGTEGEENGTQSLNGMLPINEMVNLDGVDDKDNLNIDWAIEDLNIEMIHSRRCVFARY